MTPEKTQEVPAVSDYRLPAGRHGLPAEEVAENQRWRLLGAAPEVLLECGYVRTTSVLIAKRAGVSSATFYENFENVAAALRASYEVAADCLLQVVAEACDDAQGGPQRVGACVSAALDFLRSEPALANLLGDEAPAGDVGTAAAREDLIDRLAELLRSVSAEGGAGAWRRPEGAERHLISGALAIVSERIAAGEVDTLSGLAPELSDLLSAG